MGGGSNSFTEYFKRVKNKIDVDSVKYFTMNDINSRSSDKVEQDGENAVIEQLNMDNFSIIELKFKKNNPMDSSNLRNIAPEEGVPDLVASEDEDDDEDDDEGDISESKQEKPRIDVFKKMANSEAMAVAQVYSVNTKLIRKGKQGGKRSDELFNYTIDFLNERNLKFGLKASKSIGPKVVLFLSDFVWNLDGKLLDIFGGEMSKPLQRAPDHMLRENL